MKFIALDVETANADMSSICSIGLACYDNGEITGEWYSLIDPKDDFDYFNIRIHGITEADVKGAPTFKEAADTISDFMDGQIAVIHTHFDRTAIHQASQRWSINPPKCSWLDSARVARRTWPEVANAGYGLANVCKIIGYNFKHHNALEDAKAAGQVLLAAMDIQGLDLEGMANRVTQPIDPSASSVGAAVKRDGNPDGPLTGEVAVFTGALEIPRNEAADLAASIGCSVGSGVTKKTTLLIVGDLDITKLAGHEKSGKHRKAEKLISKGQHIRIIRETDFKELVALGNTKTT